MFLKRHISLSSSGPVSLASVTETLLSSPEFQECRQLQSVFLTAFWHLASRNLGNTQGWAINGKHERHAYMFAHTERNWELVSFKLCVNATSHQMNLILICLQYHKLPNLYTVSLAWNGVNISCSYVPPFCCRLKLVYEIQYNKTSICIWGTHLDFWGWMFLWVRNLSDDSISDIPVICFLENCINNTYCSLIISTSISSITFNDSQSCVFI